MILHSGELTLRPWCASDASSLATLANDRDISKNLRDRFPFPYTLDDAHAWIMHCEPIKPAQSFCILWQGQVAGGMGVILGSDIYKKSAEIGYWLGKPFWGKGIAAECLKLACPYYFSTFGLCRIVAGVFETNPASARVLEKAGFSFECRQKKSVFKDGKVLDQLQYILLS